MINSLRSCFPGEQTELRPTEIVASPATTDYVAIDPEMVHLAERGFWSERWGPPLDSIAVWRRRT